VRVSGFGTSDRLVLLHSQTLELEKAHDEAQLATLSEYMGQGGDVPSVTSAELPSAGVAPQSSDSSGHAGSGQTAAGNRVRSCPGGS
jgi:hypothetical protein